VAYNGSGGRYDRVLGMVAMISSFLDCYHFPSHLWHGGPENKLPTSNEEVVMDTSAVADLDSSSEYYYAVKTYWGSSFQPNPMHTS
jgi:hypothetical protein